MHLNLYLNILNCLDINEKHNGNTKIHVHEETVNRRREGRGIAPHPQPHLPLGWVGSDHGLWLFLCHDGEGLGGVGRVNAGGVVGRGAGTDKASAKKETNSPFQSIINV